MLFRALNNRSICVRAARLCVFEVELLFVYRVVELRQDKITLFNDHRVSIGKFNVAVQIHGCAEFCDVEHRGCGMRT